MCDIGLQLFLYHEDRHNLSPQALTLTQILILTLTLTLTLTLILTPKLTPTLTLTLVASRVRKQNAYPWDLIMEIAKRPDN